MAFFLRIKLVGCALLLLGLASCAGTNPGEEPPRPKRPVAGDTVTPVILLGKTWKQKGLVLVSAKFRVEGKDGSSSQLLQLEEVPYEIVPRATLTFFEDDRQLDIMEEVHLTRDC